MSAIFAILFLLAGAAVVALSIVFGRGSPRKSPLVVGIVLAALSLLWIGALTFTTVDAGEVGIMVQFGKILDRQLQPGINLKNIFSDVIKFPVRLQQYTMSIAPQEGAPFADDSIDVLTSDQLTVKVDCTVWWMPDPEKITLIYSQIAPDIDILRDTVIRAAARTALRNVTASYSFTDLIAKRESYLTDIMASLRELTGNKYVIIDRILIRNMLPPEMVKQSIERKLATQQELEQKDFELETARKQAEIRRVEAQGIADAQAIIQAKLTPLYVQYEAIKAYEKLAGSPNTTFVIMPTSTEGAGMPIILGTDRGGK